MFLLQKCEKVDSKILLLIYMAPKVNFPTNQTLGMSVSNVLPHSRPQSFRSFSHVAGET